jgi:hypothetical protein
LLLAVPAIAQELEYLSDADVQAALQSTGKKHHTNLIDMQMLFANTGSGHGRQIPQIDIYMPDAWIATQAKYAKSQYQKYDPKPDSLKAITVVAVGIVIGTNSGPSCDSVSRIALISDKEGGVVVEAVQTDSVSSSWHNGFGASAACKSATSKFLLGDLEKVRAASKDGQFIVGVFYEGGSRKLYTVKKQYLKELGL